MCQLSIVIPTFNEKDNVGEIVRRIENTLLTGYGNALEIEILFIDDSTDNTPEVLSQISMEKSYVCYVHREKQRGLATAVLLGFEMAKGKYVAVMDADLQHPPEILKGMYAAITSCNADFCIPSRLIPGGYDGGLNWYRKIISNSARIIGQIMLPCLKKISDPTSGLFMFRRDIISNADMRPIGWKIMIEVIATASYSSIVEIPYAFQNRFSGESKLDGKVTLQYLQQCMSLRKRCVRNTPNVVTWSTAEMESAVNNVFGA